jgi:hypothetical protein
MDSDDAGGTQKLNKDRRWQDQAQAVPSVCSSLLLPSMVIDLVLGSPSHFSVKELSTSPHHCKVSITAALPAPQFLSFHSCHLTPALAPSQYSSVPCVALILPHSPPVSRPSLPIRVAPPHACLGPLAPRPSSISPTCHPRPCHPRPIAKCPESSVSISSHPQPCAQCHLGHALRTRCLVAPPISFMTAFCFMPCVS